MGSLASVLSAAEQDDSSENQIRDAVSQVLRHTEAGEIRWLRTNTIPGFLKSSFAGRMVVYESVFEGSNLLLIIIHSQRQLSSPVVTLAIVDDEQAPIYIFPYTKELETLQFAVTRNAASSAVTDDQVLGEEAEAVNSIELDRKDLLLAAKYYDIQGEKLQNRRMINQRIAITFALVAMAYLALGFVYILSAVVVMHRKVQAAGVDVYDITLPIVILVISTVALGVMLDKIQVLSKLRFLKNLTAGGKSKKPISTDRVISDSGRRKYRRISRVKE